MEHIWETNWTKDTSHPRSCCNSWALPASGVFFSAGGYRILKVKKVHMYLVGGFNPFSMWMYPFSYILSGWWCHNHLEKYEFVNGKDYIPYIMEKNKCLKPPTSIDIIRYSLGGLVLTIALLQIASKAYLAKTRCR